MLFTTWRLEDVSSAAGFEEAEMHKSIIFFAFEYIYLLQNIFECMIMILYIAIQKITGGHLNQFSILLKQFYVLFYILCYFRV